MNDKEMRKIMTSIWMKALWVTLCSVILAVIINFGFEKLKPYLGVDEINYMKYYYDKANALPYVYPGGISEDIVLVTTQSRKRGEIARLIQQICQKDPLALGVDMRFVDERDPRTDSLLLGVLTQYRNKLILARARGNGIKNSFFDRGSEDALFTYGLTHIRSSLRYCPQTGNPPENLFSYAVAQKVKPDIAFDSSLIVNYETCYFHKYTEDEVLQMTEDDELRGKIVILGDDQDNKDFHDMPFLIAGQDGCQGLYLQAYAIRSLLDDNVAFKELSFLPNLLICFLLTYVFSLIFSLFFC